MDLLQKEQRLLQVVKLVGPDVLPQPQRLILESCLLFKNIFLQQVAFDAVDTHSSARKQFLMLKAIITFYRKSDELVHKGVSVAELRATSAYQELLRMRFSFTENQLDDLARLVERIEESLEELNF
jgi:V/A-type H+-transporting ATPase subunit A